MSYTIECVEFFVGVVVILRYILTKLSCSQYRMTTTDMSELGRASDLYSTTGDATLVSSVNVISSGIDLMNGLLFTK